MEYLKPVQQPHCDLIINILENSLFACDFSVMGAGKTWVANVIGVETGLPIFYFGPRGSLSAFEEVSRAVGGRIAYISTYESIRSVRGCQPKHGYLHRYDYEDGSVGFATTKAFRDLVDAGIILVCDECQKIKNNSDQTKAVRALIRDILDQGGKSRVIFLSGSPFEEKDHALNFFRLIGFVTHPKMYNVSRNGDFTLLGLQELIDHLSYYRPDETQAIIEQYLPFSKRNIKDFVFSIFTEIIVPYFSSAMPSPVVNFRKDVGNGYYLFGDQGQENQLIAAINGLQRATAFNARDGTIHHDGNNLGAITIALQSIELAKVPIFARKARQDLEATPNGKVIIFTNYTQTIDRLTELLSDYNPVIYDGRLNTRKKEDEVIHAFQEGGRRLLIGNLKKGGIALNLHDTHGNEPRTTYISPTFSILDMHQASGRTYRPGLASDATIRVVYGELATEEIRVLESRILMALSRKTENLKEITKRQAQEGVLFPGEYPPIHEEAI